MINFKEKKLFLLLLTLSFFLFWGFQNVKASGMESISDTISTSQPEVGAIHTIRFTAVSEIPSSGSIRITPREEAFLIPSEMSYQDVQLFINDSEQNIGSSPGAGVSGVEVIDGDSGSVTINLASDLTINPTDRVRIIIGSEDNKIINPDSTGPYGIRIQTYNQANSLMGTASAFIFIVDPVSVNTFVEVQDPLVATIPANVLDMNTAILRGELLNLASYDSVHLFFQYRLKVETEEEEEEEGEEEEPEEPVDPPEVEPWTDTGLFGRSSPVRFSELVGGLEKGTTYEFRAGVEWFDEEDEEIKRGFGEIEEFTTYEKELEEKDEEEQPEGGPGDADFPGGTGPGPGGGSGPRPGGEPADPAPEELPDPPPYLALRGWSYPGGSMTLIQNNEEVLTGNADSSAYFDLEINEPLSGTHNFVLRAEDTHERALYETSMTLETNPERGLLISGIFFPPSVELDSDTVSSEGEINIYGETIPGITVDIRFWEGEDEIETVTTSANNEGQWSYTIEGGDFEDGRYGLRVRGRHGREESSFSDTFYFNVGEVGCAAADINRDGRVGLPDFSILMHHWGTDEPSADLNKDGVVDLVDFSIMMSCWTG